MNKIIGYIHIKGINEEVGVIEVHIQGELKAKYKIKNYEIIDEITIDEKDIILDAVETSKYVNDYKIKNNIEMWDCSTIPLRA